MQKKNSVKELSNEIYGYLKKNPPETMVKSPGE
jgi:hypothetical protein